MTTWEMALVLVRVSRPRFWLYLGGTYLVGYTAGASTIAELLDGWFWVWLVFFTVPANLMLYGANDLADSDTDSVNPKKGTQEHRVLPGQAPMLRRGVVGGAALCVGLAFLSLNVLTAAFVLSFALLAFAYSVPPFRLKARPVLDSASNVLYALPGFAGYLQAGGHFGWTPVAVAGSWTAAMHLFSAIPDMASDRAARLNTTATVLGESGALRVCAVLWAVPAAYLLANGVLGQWSMLSLVYPTIPSLLLLFPGLSVYRVYWLYPIINGGLGAAAFFLLALTK